jgi:hypothetical protein
VEPEPEVVQLQGKAMKLLKAPDPDEPWGALHWVEGPTYCWRYYNMDGTLDRVEEGPVEMMQLWFEITKPENHE